MWIFTTKGLLSIVENLDNKDQLIVRARERRPLEVYFGNYKIKATPYPNDYAYRAFVPKEAVAKIIALAIQDIDYPNFKDASDKRLKSTYLDVWASCWQGMTNWKQKAAYWGGRKKVKTESKEAA